MDNSNLQTLFVPSDVERLQEIISRAGFDVWVVGGAIRDFLLGRPPKDWDLATNAPSQVVIRLFPRVVPFGLRHDTVQVHTGDRTVEITSYGRPGMEGILSDLGRRDFTMNALAMAYPDRRIIDPFSGRQDLRAGVLRAVGDASARFREDPLRTLRAGRFVSVYGFSVAGATFAALKCAATGLLRVAAERVREEMYKLLLGKNVAAAFECMRQGDVLAQVLPEILEGRPQQMDGPAHEDIYRHLVDAARFSPPRLRVRLAALFHDVAKPRVQTVAHGTICHPDHHLASSLLAAQILTRWRASRKTVQQVAKLVENHISTGVHKWSDAQIRHLLADAGIELVDDLLDLAHADRLAGQAPAGHLAQIDALRRRARLQLAAGLPLQAKDLAVDGNDLMRAFALSPGPVIGRILQELHEKVLDDPTLNERRILLECARQRLLRGGD